MKLFLIFVMSMTVAAFAKEESKHMVTFGNDFNVGWNGSNTKADVSSGLGTEDYNITKGNLSLNYAYRIIDHLQLGAAISSASDKTEHDFTGGTIQIDEKTTSGYLFAIFNFSDDLTETFYVMAGLGRETVEIITDNELSPSSNSKVEYDISGYLFRLGKRFNLKLFNIENLTYSPSITFKYGDVGGDLKDNTGVDTFTTMQLDLIKFDLLF